MKKMLLKYLTNYQWR